MSWMDRLSNVLRGRDLNSEIDEELQFHIDSRACDNLGTGLDAEQARRDALVRFGGRAAIREQTRDANVLLSLDALMQDLSFAARSLRKRPVFALGAILTLALGIGANATILTVVRSVLLRPLPFPDSDRICAISYASPGAPFWLYPGLSDRVYLAFREGARTFDATATFATSPLTLSGSGEAVRLTAATVTPDFFRVLRVDPALGTGFAPDQDQPGQDHVVLLGNVLWRTRFGGDPALVGRSIILDGKPHLVLGVLPEGVQYPANVDVWTPLLVRNDPHLTFIRPVIGRLKAGIGQGQARAALEALVATIPQDPGYRHDEIAGVVPLKDAVVGDVRRPLAIFSGAVAFVLLIACANVANLLLMRAVTRRQEIATRLALGASRGRLVRQLLTESAVLSMAGGVAALVVATLAAPVLLTFVPPGTLPRDSEIRVDGWILAVTLGLSMIAGLLVGLAPALQTVSHSISSSLKEGVGAPTRRSLRVRHALIVTEMALALVLLVGAGLLSKSFLKLRAIDPGFEPSHVMTMTLDLPDTRYPTALSLTDFHQLLLESLSSLPDVNSAGVVNWMPLGDMYIRGDFRVEGLVPAPSWNVTKAAVSAGYFRAMGIRLVSGRDFSPRDDAKAAGVVIVNEAMARRIWAHGDALGRRISVESSPKPQDWLTIVGVVADVRQNGLSKRVPPAVYQPYQQVARAGWLSRMTYVVRTNGEPGRVAPLMRTALKAIDGDQAPYAMATMEDVVAGTIAEPRFQTRLFAAFSMMALLLSAIGVYGVLASSVVERRREIAIRMALGAERSSVAWMIVKRTLRLSAFGVIVGLVGGPAVTKALSRLLFEVAPTDIQTFVAAAVLLMIVAIAAGVIPARRAGSVDPLASLRLE